MIENQIVALPCNYIVDYDDALGIDMDQAAADVAVFTVPFRCEVIEVGGAVTETCAGGTTTPVIDFDLRPTAGSDSGRGAADLGHLVLSTTAAGKVMYDMVGVGTILEPGNEVVCQLAIRADGTGSAGHVRPYILVMMRSETKANLDNMVETA
ncbi:MAG: hypothetical protein ABFD76_05165 [Smithella sp.]